MPIVVGMILIVVKKNAKKSMFMRIVTFEAFFSPTFF
jgi:hypothetical protein